MKAIILVTALLTFAAVFYAIHKDYGVKTAMKWLGGSLTFEAEKRDKTGN